MTKLILQALVSMASGPADCRRLIVLIYHRVFAEFDFMYPHELDVHKFKWQMELLASHFNVLSLPDALNHLRDGTLPLRAVCITFDDGYADNYLTALPILKHYGLPATFFVVSGAIDQDRMWRDNVVEAFRSFSEPVVDLTDMGLGRHSVANYSEKALAAAQVVKAVKYLPLPERIACCDAIAQMAEELPKHMMLTTEQLKAMCAEGMEIGAHTVSHPILKNLPRAEWQQEILGCKSQLEALLQKPIRFFAYPNGKFRVDYEFSHRDFVEKCGYEAALSTEWGCVTSLSDRFQLPRFTPWDSSPNRFMLRMANMYWRG